MCFGTFPSTHFHVCSFMYMYVASGKKLVSLHCKKRELVKKMDILVSQTVTVAV